ncbi:MAG: hypothetical protein KBG20_13795 [Caldilineaceae bacterium]|nr:hypothetical protein [Caldilineaceae bacterium]MBP8106051.1 hypothetical protein [Caldilineaceae bacterium]MBP8121943.1 hypothetical protein [Caldilineaceae bacterium]MBP9073373.1 hypothetical protein [Caldilineaceae bacterium]
MLASITGVYRNGHIDLAEQPLAMPEGTEVLVTFLEPGTINLRERGIDYETAAEMRSILESFATEWESPEMDIYDDYDTNRLNRSSR